MEGARLLPAQQLTLAFGSISSSYASMGSLLKPARIYYVSNTTNVALTFSIDGVNDYFTIPAGGYLQINAGAARGTPQTSAIPQGQPLYVKGSGASSGGAFLSYWYAD